jgi:hypothetical protein
VLEFRSYDGASAGVALIRDGNGTRSFETLMRYRSAAMAEFMRALRTLKALQAEQAEELRHAPRSSGCRRDSRVRRRASRLIPRQTNPSVAPNPHLSAD